MGLSNNLSCEAGSLPSASPTPMGVFNQRFEALFPCAGALGYMVCYAPRGSPWSVGLRGATRSSACPVLRLSESGPLGLSVRECGAAGSASGQTACSAHPTLCHSLSRHGHRSPLCPGAISAPPTGLDICFGLPCRSIFCQFWLCQEAWCVYLCHHLGSPSKSSLNF